MSIGLEVERHTTTLQILMDFIERLQYLNKMEKNVYVFGGKTAKFKATKRYVHFENFPSFIHCSDSKTQLFLSETRYYVSLADRSLICGVSNFRANI